MFLFINCDSAQVLLQVVEVKDLPETQQGNLFVAFAKQQDDSFLSGSYVLKIQSETEDQYVASFQCEATGDLVLTLVADSRCKFARSIDPIGKTSISIDKLAGSNSKLFLRDWLQLVGSHQSESTERDTNPISILVVISVSVPVPVPVPVPAPYVFYMIKGKSMIYNSCFLLCPGMIPENYWTHFIHGHGNEIISLKIRWVYIYICFIILFFSFFIFLLNFRQSSLLMFLIQPSGIQLQKWESMTRQTKEKSLG